MNAASSALPLRTVPIGGAGDRGGAAGVGAEAAQQHVEDAAVHALAHDVRQDRAGRAHQCSGDDQRKVLDGEADAARRPAGVAVQHRDDDRHVGAADRDDQQEAERNGKNRDQPEDRLQPGRDECDDQQQQDHPERRVQRVLVGKRNRRARHQRLQLRERDHRAGKRDRADREPERHLDQALGVDAAGHADAERLRRVQRRRRDEHRGEADQRMERRDQLRQRRHLDAERDERAGAAADQDAEHDQAVAPAGHVGVRERRDHGDRHAGDAHHVAAPRAFGMRQAAQRQHEQDGRDQVGERSQGRRHLGRLISFSSGTSATCGTSPRTRRKC